MATFSDIIEKIGPSGETHIPADWLQGRTTYGGLSAALCLAGAQRAYPDLPPLRGAQFAFIGPAAGDLKIIPTILRQGKNTVFVGVDLQAETGLATRAMLTFAAARESSLRYRATAAPAVPPPTACADFFAGRKGPNFTTHFDILRAGGNAPMSGATEPELLVWFRHRDPAARAGLVGLIALADALPPAAFSMFSAPAQISTVTWSIEVLDTQTASPGAAEGWHLVRSRGDHIADGYSSQEMILWNAHGAAVLIARQLVALFT